MSLFKTVYDGVEITYDESRNVWCFELRGRQRSAESFVKAKEAIDAPPPKEKKTFARVKAFLTPDYYGNAFRPIEVTSIAEQNNYVWVVDVGGTRSKERIDSVILDTPENRETMKRWVEFNKLEKKAGEDKTMAMKRLARFVIEPE